MSTNDEKPHNQVKYDHLEEFQEDQTQYLNESTQSENIGNTIN